MMKFSLLYIDDEESNLRIFKDTFRRKFKVFTVNNATKGIQILKSENIDLILSDQRMPEITGVEFLKYCFENFPEPNRILITGYSDFEAIENAINKAHIFQYVQKPWSEKSLSNTIDSALKIYQLEQENKRQKQELILAKQKAEESDLLKTEFINNMSHEIRTPLNGILGYSQILNLIDLKNVEELRSYTHQIIECGGHLTNIIDDILEISALQTHQVMIKKKEVDLRKITNQLFHSFQRKAKEKNLIFQLENECCDQDIIIETDPEILKKILRVFLNNALKFTQSGYVKFGLKKEEINESDNLLFFVEDSGIGIHSENFDLIFNNFTQEEKKMSRRFGGLGLGLPIAKGNANLIDGEISLKSKKNKGTTFFFRIPFKAIDKLNPKKIPQRAKKYTILIVEDEKGNFIYLKNLLEVVAKIKGKILHAETGISALEICKQEKLDLIFMDLEMPKMNGFKAIKKIRETDKTIPIIVQSAYTTYEFKEKALKAGCDDFISKPLEMEVVMNILDQYLHPIVY